MKPRARTERTNSRPFIGYVAGVAKLKAHVVIGRNIHRLRNEHGMTQEMLAEKAAIDRRSLQRIEAGQWNMTVNYLDKLKEALGCSWSQLVEGL